MLTETRKGVDEIIAQCFPEYAHKSVEIAWNAIYDFIKAEETPTSTYVNNKKSGVIEIELHH